MTTSGSVSAGRRLGRYHLSEPLGGGPTGEVFRAKVYGVAGFERQFAVKRFHPSFVADPAVAAQVATAARTYGSLEHPRIARLHEYGVAGGETFTATELVEGVDLARLIDATFGRGEPLVIGGGVALLSQAARAVGFAHGRGIFHLGLCPTNLVCTPHGDIKVTDFGLLPARLPSRPEHDDSLAARIPYLAPEQLAGEPTSAATDVFQLGVIAFEALGGARAFTGDEPLEVAQRIMSGQPDEPLLPRPLVKVLMRSIARSPFERYPDARALADALDAAARTAPLPGGRREVGNAVRAARDSSDEWREGQLSGALQFPMPAPPRVSPTSVTPVVPPPEVEPARAVAPPPVSPARATVQAKVPPLPAPRAATAPAASAAAAVPAPKQTAMGVPAPLPPGAPRLRPPAIPGQPPNAGGAEADEDSTTIVQPGARTVGRETEEAVTAVRLPGVAAPAEAGSRAATSGPAPEPAAAAPVDSLSPPRLPLPMSPPLLEPEPAPVLAPARPSGGGARARKALWAAIGGLGAVAAGLGIYLVVAGGGGAADAARADAPARPAALAAVGGQGSDQETDRAEGAREAAAQPEPDSAEAAAAGRDAPEATEDDGDPEDAVQPEHLVIRSDPPGARVYVDGSLKGKTPVTLDASIDRHKLALVLPGHKLHIAEIAGAGEVTVELEEVTPPGGPAGIKVRCKTKNRYYVFIDGKPVGQLCPSERIGVELGERVVEIYDPVTDTRREFQVHVKQTRRSTRVRVD